MAIELCEQEGSVCKDGSRVGKRRCVRAVYVLREAWVIGMVVRSWSDECTKIEQKLRPKGCNFLWEFSKDKKTNWSHWPKNEKLQNLT